MKVGLIGGKLGHSFSKTIHEQLADYTYDLIPLQEDEFHDFMKKKEFNAINVTIPYKEKVIPYCDEIDEKAKAIHAVNAIKHVNGKLIATNTDFDGLMLMIKRHFDLRNKIVAICGSGGTSKTAYAVCQALQAREILQIARNRPAPYLSYKKMKSHQEIEIIINTTSVGMSPAVLDQIVDLHDFPQCQGVIDVVYNPLTSALCYQAKLLHIPYVGGLEMLIGQAVRGIEFFTGKQLDETLIPKMTHQLYHDKVNLVLIGMPGCGKTSLGQHISSLLGLDFIDIDEEIEKKANRSIPEIFKDGEEVFRDIETEVCLEAAQRNHSVISCGGGVIKREINMKGLALNGFIIFIDRDVNQLAIGNGRPLSTDLDTLKKMEKERLPYYLKYSDTIVKNNEHFLKTADRLMEVYHEIAHYEWTKY